MCIVLCMLVKNDKQDIGLILCSQIEVLFLLIIFSCFYNLLQNLSLLASKTIFQLPRLFVKMSVRTSVMSVTSVKLTSFV